MRTFTWISPRGTLEVLDDYPYWIGQKMGYFSDLVTDMQPGPSDGTATVKFVDVGQADMGFPSPGVFSFALENGMDLVSVFHMGALDTFSFAFRKGEGSNDLKTLEGKTVLLGSAAWQAITDPMLAAQGVDVSKITYVEAGWPTWGTALAAGQGDAALSWEGLRAEWIATGLEFEYWLGVQNSHLSGQHLRRAPVGPRGRRQARLSRGVPAGWAMGLEFAYHNPRGRGRSRVRAVPDAGLEPRRGARHHVDPPADQRLPRRYGSPRRLGLARHGELAGRSSTRSTRWARSRSRSTPSMSCTNEFIGPANDFDHEAVKAEADAFELSADMQALDMEAIQAGLFDASIQG